MSGAGTSRPEFACEKTKGARQAGAASSQTNRKAKECACGGSFAPIALLRAEPRPGRKPCVTKYRDKVASVSW